MILQIAHHHSIRGDVFVILMLSAIVIYLIHRAGGPGTVKSGGESNGHPEKRNSDEGTANVEAPQIMEAHFLEKRAQGRTSRGAA